MTIDSTKHTKLKKKMSGEEEPNMSVLSLGCVNAVTSAVQEESPKLASSFEVSPN
jgi:hypothetical protein